MPRTQGGTVIAGRWTHQFYNLNTPLVSPIRSLSMHEIRKLIQILLRRSLYAQQPEPPKRHCKLLWLSRFDRKFSRSLVFEQRLPPSLNQLICLDHRLPVLLTHVEGLQIGLLDENMPFPWPVDAPLRVLQHSLVRKLGGWKRDMIEI